MITKALLVGGNRHGEIVELRDPAKVWTTEAIRIKASGTQKLARTLEYKDTGRTTVFLSSADGHGERVRVFVYYDNESREKGE